MEFSVLKTIGVTTGIGGAVLGVVSLIVWAILKTNLFPKGAPKQANSYFSKMTALALVLALLGVIAWFIGSREPNTFQASSPQRDGGITVEKDADRIASAGRDSTWRRAANEPKPDTSRTPARRDADKIASTGDGSTSGNAANRPSPDRGTITVEKNSGKIDSTDRDSASQSADYEVIADDGSITAEKYSDRMASIDHGPTSESTEYELNRVGGDALDLPNQIEKVFIIMQSPGPLVDGSSELYDITDPDGLLAEFSELVAYARKHGKRLIITASDSKELVWYQKEIKYNRRFLKEVLYRNPKEGENAFGAELPLN